MPRSPDASTSGDEDMRAHHRPGGQPGPARKGESPCPRVPDAQRTAVVQLANTPGRLTEVPWLARMPLSGGLVSAVSTAPLVGTLGRVIPYPSGRDGRGSFREPRLVDLGT